MSVRRLGIHRILMSEEERRVLLGVWMKHVSRR